MSGVVRVGDEEVVLVLGAFLDSLRGESAVNQFVNGAQYPVVLLA